MKRKTCQGAEDRYDRYDIHCYLINIQQYS